jgi:alpha-mannosidase
MREINKSGPFMASHLFPAVISTKQRLKLLNSHIENNLIRLLEPLQAMAYMSGARYPERLINLAWQYLLTNHSHDAINGCSLDKVYSDMLHRFSEAGEIIKSLIPLAISAVVEKIDTSSQPQGSVMLTILNPSFRQRSQLVKLAVDFDPSVHFESMGLRSRSGTLIPFQQEAVYDHGCGIDKKYHHLGFPVKRFEGYAWVENIPAMGYITLVAAGSAAPVKEGCIISGNNCLENKYLKARINENGTFNILHKETGHEFVNQHYFEDRGEAGNAWEGNVPEIDRVLTSLECKAETKIVVNGPLIGIIEIKIRMDLPVSCTDHYKRRSKVLRQVEIVSRISLAFNSRRLEIETSLENTVRDHRLRIMFDSNIQAPKYYARMPFDVVQRPVHKEIDPAWRERPETTGPAQGFTGISDGKTGLALLGQGIYEIEITDTPERTIALTLLRCFYQHGNWDKKRWNEEGFQNPGRFTFQYAVYPHKGNWEEGGVFQQYEDMNTPVKAAQHGVKKGTASWRNSLISIDNPLIQVAAVKKHEHGDGLLVRLYNPGPSAQRGVLRTFRKIKFSAYTDMEEQLIFSSLPEDHSIDLDIPHHRVINLLLKFN